MKKLAFFLLLAGLSLTIYTHPAFAATQVTVEKLETLLSSARSQSDGDVAHQLGSLDLTERLNAERLRQLELKLPGAKSKSALIALADRSEFLNPPLADIPGTATPDTPAQKHIMAQTVVYLAKTLPLLPNLFAARDTVRYESGAGASAATDLNALREAGKTRVTVLYRDGREFVDAGAKKSDKPQAPFKGMTTWGEFGPILGIVLIDAGRSHLEWSHWERSSSGLQAVFDYRVPKSQSHYDVRFCCVSKNYGFESQLLTERIAYHGQIVVDPDSGTILRLTALADADPANPIQMANIAVEYGPVEIAGHTYFCPVHGVAIASAPDLKTISANPKPAMVALVANKPALQQASLPVVNTGPAVAMLNDVSFREYHLFRGESRVLPAGEASGKASTGSSSTTSETSATIEPPSPENAVDASTADIPASAPATAAPSVAGTSTSELTIPEILVANATGLPDLPSQSQTGSDAGVTLRLNSRLVDVPVVAFDKKGHPITNLKPEELEIYDNGAKVDLRSFSPADESTEAKSSPAQNQAQSAQPKSDFSNRTTQSISPATHSQPSNFIALLIDSTLSWDDLSNTREQMRTFLNGLDSNERVSLYVMCGGGFQVLQEATIDHALVSTTLAKWRPSAQSVSLAQEQEARNRQTMDYVHSAEDLLSVNGNSQVDATVSTQALDPQLRTLGDNPGRDALAALVDIARHLGAIPGHKNLVWIASDNTLADWTYGSINIDKGARVIESSVLRTQESMNDAHVSLYPLDASRLEAGGIDATMATRNVELNPASRSPLGCGMVGSQSGAAPEASAGGDVTTCPSDLRPGRAMAQMQQDLHPIQGAYRELADATGGRTFRRASDLVSEFKSVVADGRATYQLSFTPAAAADGKYHLITVKVPGRKDVKLRYRSGFFYRQEPTTVKDRFRDAVLATQDASEIAVNADLVPGTNGRTVKLSIGASDLAIAQKDAFWTDKLDVFLAQREVSGQRANLSGQTLALCLKPATYQTYLQQGIPFNQTIEPDTRIGSVRIVVVDENSGRIGSITIPEASLRAQP